MSLLSILRRRTAPGSSPLKPLDESPWLAGRVAFAGVFADLARGKRNWQLIAFAQTALLAGVTAGYLKLSLEARITPYVVEVDRHGRAVAFGPAEAIQKTDARIVLASLSLFVRDVRAVSADPEAQREFLYRAYGHVADRARGFLDAYFADPLHDPRALGTRITRSVEVTSILRLPNSDLWRIQWTERERPRSAGLARVTAWEAIATVSIRPPRDLERIVANPLGLYVTDLDWTQLIEPKGASR